MAPHDNTLRLLVRGMYDHQKKRMQEGNRIIAEFYAREGQEPGQKLDDALDKDGKKLIADLLAEHSRLTDGVTTLSRMRKFVPGERIDTFATLALIDAYARTLETETTMTKSIKKVVEAHPLWDRFLCDVRGVGPLMAGVILSEYDIHKAKYVSSLWRYAGLDVASDGRARGRYKEHLVEQEYVDKDGKTQTKKGLGYNPFLKTKLLGVLGGSFIKQPADKCKYRKTYDDYKRRLENHARHKDKSKGHRHMMANRYAVKMFISDLYEAWRPLEGLEVHDPYSVAKLDMAPHGVDRKAA